MAEAHRNQDICPVYLDYNASAPPWAEVADAVADALRRGGNASSVHATGRAARADVESARASVARLVGADPEQVIFAGSGTEANNQALKSAGRDRALISGVEHESVQQSRLDAAEVPMRADGTVDLEALDRMLGEQAEPAIVALMLANNETGVVQPVAAAAEIAHRHGALIHCDAVQAVGKITVDMAALGVDTMALSAHKIGGPQGVGALVLGGDHVGRFVDGGGQERGLRAGTENVPGIVGYGVAAERVMDEIDAFSRLAEMRDGLERRLREIAPDITVFGEDAPRLPNTSKLSMPGVSSETQVMAMDLAGIAISAGSACSSGKVTAPYVLTAMGVAPDLAVTAVRVSLGWGSTPADVDRFVEAWRELYSRAGKPGPADKAA